MSGAGAAISVEPAPVVSELAGLGAAAEFSRYSYGGSVRRRP
jgi:hypothetical protein